MRSELVLASDDVIESRSEVRTGHLRFSRLSRLTPLFLGIAFLVSACSSGGSGLPGFASVTTLNGSATIECADIDVSPLLPAHVASPRDQQLGTVSVTEFSSCGIELDTNGDGIVNAFDELADSLYVMGGLTETLDGEPASIEILDDPELWSNLCSGERESFEASGWTNAVACVEDGAWKSAYFLLAGETEDGQPAAVSCGVDGFGGDINPRRADIEFVCNQVRDAVLVGGAASAPSDSEASSLEAEILAACPDMAAYEDLGEQLEKFDAEWIDILRGDLASGDCDTLGLDYAAALPLVN